jgi:hypothetical protein
MRQPLPLHDPAAHLLANEVVVAAVVGAIPFVLRGASSLGVSVVTGARATARGSASSGSRWRPPALLLAGAGRVVVMEQPVHGHEEHEHERAAHQREATGGALPPHRAPAHRRRRHHRTC